MTDRELLELAAKAAGFNAFAGHAKQMIESGWNPLTDDGDALRLAVKLHIPLRFEEDFDGWGVVAGTDGEMCKPDPYAATRRAIVRAAAEIGKEMK